MRRIDWIEREPVILTEGALIERLRRDDVVPLDPDVLHAGFVYDERGRAALAGLWRGYLDAGRAGGLPMIACTPTWRANPERLRAARLSEREVNADAVRLLHEVRAGYGPYGERVAIGGLMGCRGDAYDPLEALSADEAATFHGRQARALADAGVGFLLAATLPALSEAAGMARALAATGVPYVLSFVLRPAGTLLDGTPLHEAIRRIDGDTAPAPLGYWANCVHPTVFAEAMLRTSALAPVVAQRIIGLQANTSRRSPEELDGAAALDAEEPGPFATAMVEVQQRFRLRVVGGCCGTDDRHIRALAERLTAGAGCPRRPTC